MENKPQAVQEWALGPIEGGQKILLRNSLSQHSYRGLVVGRHPSLCEFVLEEPTISHRHLRLKYSGSGWLAEDLNSLNGTYLNDIRLKPFQPTALRANYIIELGALAFRVIPINAL